MRYQVGESGLLSGLVWRSTPESIADGRISVLACAEVIFSVYAYWWIYATWDTALHLLVSACVAPLVLFRSDESVKAGHRMWQRWRNSANPPAWSFWPVFIARTILAALVGWLIGQIFEPVQSSLGALACLAVAGTGGAVISVSAVSAINLRLISFSGRIGYFLPQLLASCVAAVAAGIAVGGAGLATLWSVALIVLLPLAAIAGFVAAGGAGYFLRAAGTRLCSAASYLGSGLRCVPQNWRRIQASTDLFTAPELIPRVADIGDTETFQVTLTEALEDENLLYGFFLFIVLAVWAIPTTVYRYSLKATFWIYLPVLMTRVPAKLRDGEARREFIAAYTRPIWDWIQLAVALGALTYAVISAIDWANVEALAEVRTGETPLTPYHLLLILDLGRLDWWNAVSVPAAALTVILFLWIDWLRWHKADPMGLQVTTVLRAMTLRNWLAYAWALVALYAFAGDAYRLCLLPEWFDWLGWHYGEKHCPAPSG